MKLQEFRSGHFFDQLEVGGGDGNVFKYLFGSYFRVPVQGLAFADADCPANGLQKRGFPRALGPVIA